MEINPYAPPEASVSAVSRQKAGRAQGRYATTALLGTLACAAFALEVTAYWGIRLLEVAYLGDIERHEVPPGLVFGSIRS
jgi:hypothetical protein